MVPATKTPSSFGLHSSARTKLAAPAEQRTTPSVRNPLLTCASRPVPVVKGMATWEVPENALDDPEPP